MNARKDGLSGLMRLKNEARFVGACIDSCIGALDELVIVYNDCTDGTPEIVESKRQQYPDKIKVYPYNYHVLSHNLTPEEFEQVQGLPDDSPQLLCNYCNYALSKATYRFAVKIDADQLYFTDEIKKWKDVCSGDSYVKWNASMISGWLFMVYFSLYRRLSAKSGKPCLWMLPDRLVKHFSASYLHYAAWRLKKGTVAVALSGFNVFKDDRWYIPFDTVNAHPPYNGEGDTLIFKITDKTYFTRYVANRSFVIERFNNPYKVMFGGPVWFHLHAMRNYCRDKVQKCKDNYPEQFVPVENFPSMKYKDVLGKWDTKSQTLYQRILFALIHKTGADKIYRHLFLLK